MDKLYNTYQIHSYILVSVRISGKLYSELVMNESYFTNVKYEKVVHG